MLKATTLCTACFVVLGWLFSIKMMTIPFLAMFWALSTLIVAQSEQHFDLPWRTSHSWHRSAAHAHSGYQSSC